MTDWLIRFEQPLVTEPQLASFGWLVSLKCRIQLETEIDESVEKIMATIEKLVPKAGKRDRILLETTQISLQQQVLSLLLRKGFHVFIPTWIPNERRLFSGMHELTESILFHGHQMESQPGVMKSKPKFKSKPPSKRQPGPTSKPAIATSKADFSKAQEIDHRIHKLQPSRRWHVLMDESLVDFTFPVNFTQSGKMVAVVLPEEQFNRIQSLALNWHSVGKSETDIRRRLQKLIENPIGIIGMAASEFESISGDKYPMTVLGVIALILRFLPIQGKTMIEVFVERRGDNEVDTNWKMAAAELCRQLEEVDPRRATEIKLTIKTIAKGDHKHLAYADIIGHTWLPQREKRLLDTGLSSNCLIPNYATLMNQLWDKLASGRQIDPEQWSEYVSQEAANDPETLPGHLFERVKQACREDRALWNKYASETLRHLESKAVSLPRLHREIAWLRDCVPQLPPKLELAFLTARLAEANHIGAAFFDEYQQIAALTARLVEEDPALCCWADLHLAVSCTNRYAFFEALNVIGPWLTVGPLIPGLQMWARVRSTAGQLAAFGGNPRKAVSYFNEALAAFTRLSDPEEAAREQLQTGTYRAIATMDDPKAKPDEVLAALTAVLGKLPAAVARLAVSEAPADKYLHVLLLRFLALHPEGKPLIKTYLRTDGDWKTGEGHPWEWIEAYRALILHRDGKLADAQRHADRALALALEPGQGPILQWIGLVQARLFLSLELTISRPLPNENELVALLPGLSSCTAALNRLNKPRLQRPLSTLLPFNFH